ncbi:MAG: polysaccharide pyruvyl transferase family protein [Oscillospiraceae bacterium]|nr:polysaccharide pyruvyl transferase family protein [Oscillospiraceae bacterium]
MRKILVRAAVSPLANHGPWMTIQKDTIATNTGNLIYQASVFKMLDCGDVQIDALKTSRPTDFTPREAARINREYDMFVIPLANAFRASFAPELARITKLVNMLKIPCVVVGVGLQAPVNADPGATYPFDKTVRQFVKAVLKKSAMLGLRGEMTGDYLANLGFTAEKDFTVIGCPSMFMHGAELPMREKLPLTAESPVCINVRKGSPKAYAQFIENCRQQLPNHTIIPQNLVDLKRLYYAKTELADKHYAATPDMYNSGRVKMFCSVQAWTDYIAQTQFCFGRRIHGNIAGILAGTPSFVFAPDSRIIELARYHAIPHMLLSDVTPQTDIFELYASADYSAMQTRHAETFDHYANFLQNNGIKHAYEQPPPYPFGEKTAAIRYKPPVEDANHKPMLKHWRRLVCAITPAVKSIYKKAQTTKQAIKRKRKQRRKRK